MYTLPLGKGPANAYDYMGIPDLLYYDMCLSVYKCVYSIFSNFDCFHINISNFNIKLTATQLPAFTICVHKDEEEGCMRLGRLVSCST